MAHAEEHGADVNVATKSMPQSEAARIGYFGIG